jgi:peptidylprolyl isomerase
MRRAAALAFVPLIAIVTLAGCGSSSSSKPAAAVDTYKSVEVTGGYGTTPKVTIPKVKPNGALLTKTITQGTGPVLTSTEGAYGNFVVYDWSATTSKLLSSAYSPTSQSLFVGGQMIAGVEKSLVGQKMGSRVLAVVPPSAGLGSAATSEGIGASDTLVFVVDLESTFNLTSVSGKQTSNAGGALPTVAAPATATAGPTLKINTKAKPPAKLQVKTLVKGTGAKIAKGEELVVNYNGYIWRTGKSFQSSWSTVNQPSDVVIGEGQVIPGWDTGLVGQTVGSRVLLVIPPADGYGTSGLSQAGIKGTDTLAFVVDVLAASKG